MKRSPSIQPPEFSLPSSQTIPPRAKRELGYWEWFRSRGFPFDVPARRAYLEDYPDMNFLSEEMLERHFTYPRQEPVSHHNYAGIKIRGVRLNRKEYRDYIARKTGRALPKY